MRQGYLADRRCDLTGRARANHSRLSVSLGGQGPEFNKPSPNTMSDQVFAPPQAGSTDTRYRVHFV